MKDIRIKVGKYKGFTLVELMVSIVISSIIMLGVVSLYTTSRRGHNTNESLARIQENLRFAANMITRDIRMAGYSGCRSFSNTNTVEETADYGYSQRHITGYESADVPSAFPAIGTNPGDRIADTDAVAIVRVSSTGFKITGHNSSSATMFLDATAAGIEDGDILAVSDCNHSAVFRVSGPTNPSDHIVHNTGAVADGPKNCWKKMGPVGNPKPTCGASGGTEYTYDDNARVHKYIMHGYFIGVSKSGLTKSLYVLNLDKGVLSATELVEGVENFQLSYGLDSDDDGFPERFLIASDVSTANWENIVSVKYGMILVSIDDVKKADAATGKSFTIAGTTVTAAADKKLRFHYNSSVKIRNKGIR